MRCMRPAGGAILASVATASSSGTSEASSTPSTPSRFCALNAPTTGERSVVRPQGVATSSTIPVVSSDIGCRRDVRGAEAVRQHALPALARGVDEALAEGVVGVDHRRAQAGPREELRLGTAVRGHRLVIVEMIAREVREQRDVELRAVDAALVEPVRRHFHRNGLGACGVKLREELVEQGDIGRGVRRRRERADQPVSERSEDCRAPPAHVERLRDPLRARRLAVGARDAGHPQFARRAAVDEVRDVAEPRLQSDRCRDAAPATPGPTGTSGVSHSTADAPRAIASGTNLRPSDECPGYAANATPGSTRRLSDVMRRGYTPSLAEQRGHVEIGESASATAFLLDFGAVRREDHVVHRRIRGYAELPQRRSRRRSRTPAPPRRRRSTARPRARRSSPRR